MASFLRLTRLRPLRIPSLRSRHFFCPLPREALDTTGERPRLRDRPYLPGSSDGGFPEFLAGPRDSLPHAVQVGREQKCSLEEWAADCHTYIEEHLAHEGAILFRGLPLRGPEDFSVLVKELGYAALKEEGYSAYRHQVDSEASVYTSSDDPKEATIEMHSEMAYKTLFPRKAGVTLLYSVEMLGTTHWRR